MLLAAEIRWETYCVPGLWADGLMSPALPAWVWPGGGRRSSRIASSAHGFVPAAALPVCGGEQQQMAGTSSRVPSAPWQPPLDQSHYTLQRAEGRRTPPVHKLARGAGVREQGGEHARSVVQAVGQQGRR